MPAMRENTEKPSSPNFCRLIEQICTRVDERNAARQGGDYWLELHRVEAGTSPGRQL